MNKPVLECNELTKIFKDGALSVEVLKSVSFSMRTGETLAIMGSSGSGKSTLLHLLGGLDAPTSGTIRIMGENLTSLTEPALSNLRNQYFGFVYQFHHLLPEFTVLENICLPLLVRKEKISISDIKEKAYQMLEKVKISARAHHKIGEISGGERQRAAIARALITEPACVLADEPTGNLDQTTAYQIFDLLLSLNESFNTNLIIVTHDFNLAQRLQRQLKLVDGVLGEM